MARRRPAGRGSRTVPRWLADDREWVSQRSCGNCSFVLVHGGALTGRILAAPPHHPWKTPTGEGIETWDDLAKGSIQHHGFLALIRSDTGRPHHPRDSHRAEH